MSKIKYMFWWLLHLNLVFILVKCGIESSIWLFERNYVQTINEAIELGHCYIDWAMIEFQDLGVEDCIRAISDIRTFKNWFITKVWAA